MIEKTAPTDKRFVRFKIGLLEKEKSSLLSEIAEKTKLIKDLKIEIKKLQDSLDKYELQVEDITKQIERHTQVVELYTGQKEDELKRISEVERLLNIFRYEIDPNPK